MSTYESMTPLSPERLAEIQDRADSVTTLRNGMAEDWQGLALAISEDVDALLAEVHRLQRFESIVSWRYGDTTDGKTREDMTHRAAFALARRFEKHPYMQVSALGHDFTPDARAALDAALGTQEGA